MSQSRRVFLQQAAGAAALGLLPQLPARQLWAGPPSELLPQPDEALLRDLALKAVDAARAAGASFADVRLATGQTITVGAAYYRDKEAPYNAPHMGSPSLNVQDGYGVRAIVDGAWGFATGVVLTPDAVTATARQAVALARANRPRRARTLELSPVPRGEQETWATPIEQDPFAVPLAEQRELLLAAVAAAAALPEVGRVACIGAWWRSTRLFASTEGALLVQRLALAQPWAEVAAWVAGDPRVGEVALETLRRGGYGYETMRSTTLVAEMRRAAERAVAERRVPPERRTTPTEVGRYDLVLSAGCVGTLLTATLAPALDLERALGYRANREGTSFAAPPMDILGQYQVGSPLLTVRADRSQPRSVATVGWDDEGVKPEDCTLIQDGVIVDYLTTRQTAPALAAWYGRRGQPVRAHGHAGGAGAVLPAVQFPNLTMQPGKADVSVDDLIADTKRGYYVERIAFGGSDQQLINFQFRAGAREIRNGKLGDDATHFALQGNTQPFWKSMEAIGGPASATASDIEGLIAGRSPGMLQTSSYKLSTVPARFRQVNVLNVGRTQ